MNLYLEGVGFGIIAAASIALGAMGFTLQFGLTNVLNIGYGAIMSVGGFVAYACHSAGMSIWLALAVGGVSASIMTLLVAKSILSVFARRGAGLFEMAMITFGVSLIVEYGLAAVTQNNTYDLNLAIQHAIVVGPFHFTQVQLLLVILALVVFVALDLFLRLTKLGIALRATAIDPDLARASGIPTTRIVTVAWLMSGFLCGLAGGVFVVNILTVNAFTGDSLLSLVIVSALLGTAGSVRGAVLAALAIGIATQVASVAGASGYDSAVAYGVLALVLLARPKTLQGELVTDKVQITV
ncbi:MAG: branched-chain amino acid ABC transporter permease [Solirubrobacteraceae bacterium]